MKSQIKDFASAPQRAGQPSSQRKVSLLQEVSHDSPANVSLFEQEVTRILEKARDELTACQKQNKLVRVKALQKLIQDIPENPNRAIFKKAFESACCCGTFNSLFASVERACLKCSFRKLWQVGKVYEADYVHPALTKACELGLSDIIELLHRYEYDIANKIGWLPILSVLNEHSDYRERRINVAALLQYRESQTNLRATHLMMASLTGNVQMAKDNVSQAGMQNHLGWTALILAAILNHTEIVKLLADKEWNIFDNANYTALIRAASSNSVEPVRLLKARLARRVDVQGSSALIVAAHNNFVDVIKELAPLEARIRGPNGISALIVAANKKYFETVQILAPLEAKLQDDEGDTALMLAAGQGCVDAVKRLAPMEAGMRNYEGQTALLKAACGGHHQCFEFLVAKEKGELFRGMYSALMLSAKSNFPESVRKLVKYEANVQNFMGQTALMIAAEEGYLECVKHLIDAEAGNISKTGVNALSIALMSLQKDVVQVLINNHKELSVTKIPPVMMAALTGDIRSFAAARKQWDRKLQAHIAVFHCALMSPRRRLAGMVLQNPKARNAAISTTINIAYTPSWETGLMYRAMPVLVEQEWDQTLAVVMQMLKKKRVRDARRFMSFFAVRPDARLRELVGSLPDFYKMLGVFRNIGFLFDANTVEAANRQNAGAIIQCVLENPIYLKQVCLSTKQSIQSNMRQRGAVYTEIQWPFRELNASARFNCSIMRASRNFIEDAKPSRRRVIARRQNNTPGPQGATQLVYEQTRKFMVGAINNILLQQ